MHPCIRFKTQKYNYRYMYIGFGVFVMENMLKVQCDSAGGLEVRVTSHRQSADIHEYTNSKQTDSDGGGLAVR